MDEVEVLIWIEGFHKRSELLDDLLAHFTGILLSPHQKRGKAVKAEKLHRIPRRAHPGATVTPEAGGTPDNVVDLEERRRFVAEHRARVGAPQR